MFYYVVFALGSVTEDAAGRHTHEERAQTARASAQRSSSGGEFDRSKRRTQQRKMLFLKHSSAPVTWLQGRARSHR